MYNQKPPWMYFIVLIISYENESKDVCNETSTFFLVIKTTNYSSTQQKGICMNYIGEKNFVLNWYRLQNNFKIKVDINRTSAQNRLLETQ